MCQRFQVEEKSGVDFVSFLIFWNVLCDSKAKRWLHVVGNAGGDAIIGVMVGCCYPLFKLLARQRDVCNAATTSSSGLGLHNYHAAYNKPSPCSGTGFINSVAALTNRQRMSGLVAILPMIEQQLCGANQQSTAWLQRDGSEPTSNTYDPWRNASAAFAAQAILRYETDFGETNYASATAMLTLGRCGMGPER